MNKATSWVENTAHGMHWEWHFLQTTPRFQCTLAHTDNSILHRASLPGNTSWNNGICAANSVFSQYSFNKTRQTKETVNVKNVIIQLRNFGCWGPFATFSKLLRKISFPRKRCTFSKLLWKTFLEKFRKMCRKALTLSYKSKLRNNNFFSTKVRIVDT